MNLQIFFLFRVIENIDTPLIYIAKYSVGTTGLSCPQVMSVDLTTEKYYVGEH